MAARKIKLTHPGKTLREELGSLVPSATCDNVARVMSAAVQRSSDTMQHDGWKLRHIQCVR